MRKTLKILDVQQAYDVNEAIRIAHMLCGRRLARLQKAAESDPEILAWLAPAHALWRMSGSATTDTPELDSILDFRDAREPLIEHHNKFPKDLPRQDSNRIEAWCLARGRARRRPGHPLPEKMTDGEKTQIRDAAAAMSAVYLTEHEMDTAFAAIHDDYPWLASLTEKAWRQAVRRARSGLPAGVGPLLLLGPPGVGKSSWARSVARALGVPSIAVDVGATGGVWDLQGTGRGWSSAEKGRLMASIIAERTANPLIVLDEIDAGSRSVRTTGGGTPGLYKVLMGMLEPSTAARWVCPYLQVPVDIRMVSWIATCNEILHIDQPLLDRMTVISLPDLTRAQLVTFAKRQADDRFGEGFGDVVAEKVDEMLSSGKRLSLRHVSRMLDKVEEASERPLLH